jgi:septum formation protein
MTVLWRGSAPLVLASQSSTRQNLLCAAGIPFEIRSASIDERMLEAELVARGAGPREVALELSRAKASKVGAEMPGRLVLGADQVACLDGRLFGKASDSAAARSQLVAMQGRTHELHSGCCITRGTDILFETVTTAWLSCRNFSADFIENYLAQTEGSGTAATYQIEGLGAHLFDRIEGDHWTILGLPLLPILKFLREEGSLLS